MYIAVHSVLYRAYGYTYTQWTKNGKVNIVGYFKKGLKIDVFKKISPLRSPFQGCSIRKYFKNINFSLFKVSLNCISFSEFSPLCESSEYIYGQ